jgi:CBS-domain-containing membrane protein
MLYAHTRAGAINISMSDLSPNNPLRATGWQRVRLPSLLAHYQPGPVWAVFVFINCFITLAYLSLLAYLTHFPLLFPSLGPTALLFFQTPQAESAKPRNAIAGHAMAIICGFAALLVTGLLSHPSVIAEGVSLPRVLAASLALALTGAGLVIARIAHPPAGATTLIIALGFITQPFHLLIIEVAVILLVVQSLLINRLAGVGSTGGG